VTGPLITAVLVALTGPQVAFGVSAAMVVGGTIAFLSRLPADEAEPARERASGDWLGPLRSPAIRAIALTTLPVGFCIGSIEVVVPAFSDSHGAPALAGILLSIWSAASGAGGLIFGARPARSGLVTTYLAMAVIFPLACLPVAAATSPATMAVLVIFAGLPIAPLIASRNQLLGATAPGGAGAESFTWMLTSLIAGSSLGAVCAGALSQAGDWRLAILLGVAVSAIGAAIAVVKRGAFPELRRTQTVGRSEALTAGPSAG